MNNPSLSEILNIKHPIIMAPMFLVTNTKMVKEAMKAGIAGAIPAHNFRTIEGFELALQELEQAKTEGGAWGVNLIVNRSNPLLNEQLLACLRHQPDFVITSLGDPSGIVESCKPEGIKVFCDVIDSKHARKAEEALADALIAVNNQAGGHLGPYSPEELIPTLKSETNLPVISAGGVGDSEGVQRMLNLGACGVSIGSPFIACEESPVSAEYKKAVIDYGSGDIVTTKKLSGVSCTIIKTPYVEKIGTERNLLETLSHSLPFLKKTIKTLTFYRGMSALRKAAFSATYKTVWCAGPSIDYVKAIVPLRDIVVQLTKSAE
ncbi:2-nitropropane dioxygenase [Fulvitalea axinellae]|uniref:2-nitropropane dioxygenase n=1 Tax=Fulvitalea axinellae TaxID=1182444 RepID=A0AAU9DDR3_9BACT|nr:2-nitropropane dioxygenase [Fulvitalea axinellae]